MWPPRSDPRRHQPGNPSASDRPRFPSRSRGRQFDGRGLSGSQPRPMSFLPRPFPVSGRPQNSTRTLTPCGPQNHPSRASIFPNSNRAVVQTPGSSRATSRLVAAISSAIPTDHGIPLDEAPSPDWRSARTRGIRRAFSPVSGQNSPGAGAVTVCHQRANNLPMTWMGREEHATRPDLLQPELNGCQFLGRERRQLIHDRPWSAGRESLRTNGSLQGDRRDSPKTGALLATRRSRAA